MRNLYHPTVYNRTLPINSYWETTANLTNVVCSPLSQSETCDVAIIGGGITGLSAALHLARDYDLKAHILEAGELGWGASGRNGGFCCVGSTKLSNDALVKRFGLRETRRYFSEQREAVALVRELAAEENIENDAQGDGIIQVAHRPSRLTELEAEHEFLTEVANYPCTLWSKKELSEHGFSCPEVYGALRIGVGFGLNPLKYTYGLARATYQRGVLLHPHSPVERWDKNGCWHYLHTPGGTLKARTVIVATNGYTENKLHPSFGEHLLPVLSNIITTRPLTQAELEAQDWRTEMPIWDTRRMLFYYRLLKDGRFLFGSRGGTKGSPTENNHQRSWIIHHFGQMFPGWREVEVTHFWSGLVCMSSNLSPHIGQLADDPTIFYALAYHGNGVAAGTWSGRAVARLLADKDDETSLCSVFRQPLKRFPLAALRVWYLRSAHIAYQFQDTR